MAPTSRCSICTRHRWAIDNAFLAHGSAVAREICSTLGISKSAFYRHRDGHLPLSTTTPPADNEPIEWARATTNLAAAVEQYRIIKKPSGISNLAIVVGSDDQNQFIALTIIYSEGALDERAVKSMAFEIGLDIEDEELTSGIPPIRQMIAKLHTPEIFLGRREQIK